MIKAFAQRVIFYAVLSIVCAALALFPAVTVLAHTRVITTTIHCNQPYAIPGQSIQVNGYGNGVFAPLDRSNYGCNQFGRWTATGIPVK